MRTDEEHQRITDSLLKWVKTDEACSFIGWLAIEGLDYTECDRIAEKYQPFRKAKEKALFTIGFRREQKALNGDWDAGTVRKSMALYDPAMKRHELEMKGHDIAAKAAAQVAVMNFAGADDIKKQLEALEKENKELKAKLESS